MQQNLTRFKRKFFNSYYCCKSQNIFKFDVFEMEEKVLPELRKKRLRKRFFLKLAS